MSDFLAEMEARRNRVKTPGAPVLPVILGFLAAFIATLISLPFSNLDALLMAMGDRPAQPWLIKALGAAVAITVVTSLVLWTSYVGRSRPRWILPIVAGLLVMTSIISLGFSRGIGELRAAGYQESIARAEIAKAMDLVLDDKLDSVTIDPRPKAKGDVGKAERVIKETFAAMQTIGRAYAADIKALDLEWKDDRAALTHAALRARVDRLIAAKARTEVFRAAMRAELEGMPERFRKSGASQRLQRSFMPGYERSLQGDLASLDKTLDAHLKTLDVHIAQTRFLLDRPNAWTAASGGVTFYRIEDMRRFNAFGGELQGIQNELEELRYQDRKALLESRDRVAGEY